MQETNDLLEDEPADGPVLLRKRRMTTPEKNTCQLFIQTDHLFYKYYKTREAVIAQASRGKTQHKLTLTLMLIQHTHSL